MTARYSPVPPPSPGIERRAWRRRSVDLPSHIRVDGIKISCRLVDVSEGGARVAASPPLAVGAMVELDLPGTGTVAAKVIRVTATHLALAFPGVVVLSSLSGE